MFAAATFHNLVLTSISDLAGRGGPGTEAVHLRCLVLLLASGLADAVSCLSCSLPMSAVPVRVLIAWFRRFGLAWAYSLIPNTLLAAAVCPCCKCSCLRHWPLPIAESARRASRLPDDTQDIQIEKNDKRE